jgi:hypothetical protein
VHLASGRPLRSIVTSRRTGAAIANAGLNDVTFENHFGVWNVTRAVRDCRAGKHKRWKAFVEEVYAANSNVEFSESRVAAMMAAMVWCEPLIGIVERNKIWLIDGRHRLEVLHRRGIKELLWHIIEEVDSEPYRVLFNGERA